MKRNMEVELALTLQCVVLREAGWPWMRIARLIDRDLNNTRRRVLGYCRRSLR